MTLWPRPFEGLAERPSRHGAQAWAAIRRVPGSAGALVALALAALLWLGFYRTVDHAVPRGGAAHTSPHSESVAVRSPDAGR